MTKLTCALLGLLTLAVRPAQAASSAEQTLLASLNALRAAGVTCPGSGWRPPAPALTASAAHAEAASVQARYLASSGQVTHTGQGGSTPRVRAASAGVQAVSVTEIIYLGSSPQAAAGWWLHSAVHCTVLTDPRYTQAGVSVVGSGRGMASVVVLSSDPR